MIIIKFCHLKGQMKMLIFLKPQMLTKMEQLGSEILYKCEYGPELVEEQNWELMIQAISVGIVCNKFALNIFYLIWIIMRGLHKKAMKQFRSIILPISGCKLCSSLSYNYP